jgi:hypothetical protein
VTIGGKRERERKKLEKKNKLKGSRETTKQYAHQSRIIRGDWFWRDY